VHFYRLCWHCDTTWFIVTMTGNPVVSSSSFYTSCEEPDYSSLAYSNAGTNNVPTSSGARTPPPHMQLVATSPELDAENEVEEPMPRQRSRSHSAPCVLYEQVALQLRGISDDFNREYSHHSRDEVQQQFIVIILTFAVLIVMII